MIPLRQVWPEEFAERYRRAGYWRGETIGSVLRDRARKHPERLAVIGGEIRWTYGELDRRADRLASGFLASGLSPGDRVIVHLPNIPEFLSVAFGLMRAGLAPVHALPAHRLAEIGHFARVSEAAGYVIPDIADGFDYRTLARDLVREVPAIQLVAVVGAAAEFTPLAAIEDAGGPALPAPSPSEVAFLQISGGTTGLSKLIPRTHDDYLYSFAASADICGLDEASVYLGVLPIAHNFPMSSPGTLGTLYAGGTIVLSRSPSPDACFSLIARERVTIAALVPPLALLWLDAARTTAEDLSSLKLLQVGGAKLSAEVARRIRPTFGCPLQQVFGMAEGLVNYTRPDDPEEVIVTTQGRPISPDDEVLIVGDDGRPVGEGETGHLLTRGPYTIRAYHNDPEANARSFTVDGFYRTGDIVRRRPDGNLVVEGRANDQINRGGEKISADEVETHLLAHPAIFDAAVVSVPDAYLGERSCAFIIPRGTAPKPSEIKAWIRARGLAAYKVPDRVLIVDSFHATAVGKVSRKDLRESLRRQLIAEDAAAEGKGT